MKFGSLWHSVSTWTMKLSFIFSSSRSLMTRSRMISQSLLREIVVGDEEAVQSVGDVAADDLLDVVGRAAARLAALHVDDGAERALVGAAAAGVEARLGAAGALDALARQKRDWRAFETGKVVHVIVERLERAGIGVAQYLVEAALGLAGIDRQAHRL